MRRSLQESLEDWSDWDVAAFQLAVCLGLMAEGDFPTRAKHVFWSGNPLGRSLHHMLEHLAAAGALEVREEPDRQFRWNRAFRVIEASAAETP